MKRIKVHIVIENTKYGASVHAFSTKAKANKLVKDLLKEYSRSYERPIETPEDLVEVTFNEVWIDQFESKLDEV